MTSIIKADDGVISGVTGITSTADNSGTLELQAISGLVNMNNVTGALAMPIGTTAQRPSSPITGQQRYNTTLGYLEIWNGSAWVAVGDQSSFYSIDYLVVAGGGSGGAYGAGGGAGGYIASVGTVINATAYPVTVGAGGVGVFNDIGTSGSNSVFNSQTAIGGGYGGNSATNGAAGGSGGGGAYASSPGAGTSGQGFAGGAGQNNPSGTNAYPGGGGGGASAVGVDASGGNGGAGGAGSNWQSLGTSYAGGGGGGVPAGGSYASRSAGSGGTGGGGAGGSGADGTAGTANRGGGGGGAGYNGTTSTAKTGGNGGSGIVIIRYVGAQRGTGGTVTSAGGYTYHTFTTSGTYTA